MCADYFIALRDQGASLWVEIETHRLSQADQLNRKTRYERRLRVLAGIGGAIAGVGGSQLIIDLGSIGAWIILVVGLVPGICAVLSPGEEITKVIERAQQLAALKMEIYDHVERMRVASVVSVSDVQFIDRKRQDFVAELLGQDGDVRAFQSTAQAELAKMNFHRLDYIGAAALEETDSLQDASDEIVAFPVGE